MVSDFAAALKYLGLPPDFEPSPQTAPIEFLSSQLRYLPPHLLHLFSTSTTPKQRTAIPAIRNRRLSYINSNPPELSFSVAISTWPTLWRGRDSAGKERGQDEQKWADQQFLGDNKKHVGKLGSLLGAYEEEREAERTRAIRREERELAEFVPEEDDDSDDEDGSESERDIAAEAESPEEARRSFELVIKERIIYGLLDHFDYDRVDWDERWDPVHDMDEDRWFDDEEEAVAPDE